MNLIIQNVTKQFQHYGIELRATKWISMDTTQMTLIRWPPSQFPSTKEEGLTKWPPYQFLFTKEELSTMWQPSWFPFTREE
jgi:hypothetical protein